MNIEDIKKDFNEITKNLNKIRIIKRNKNNELPESILLELDKDEVSQLSFQPHYRNITKLQLYLTCIYKNICNDSSINLDSIYLEQVKVKIKVQISNNRNKFFVYRLDSHYFSSNSLFPHPQWHVQINDRELGNDIDKSQYGNLIFLNTPRFFLFPIDIILIIDFILHNYIPNYRNNLLKNNRIYRNLLKKYQKHFWKPFFEKIYNYLNDGNDEEEAKKFLPSLI